jgi:H+/Cl- antiporter ClcA
LSAEKDDSKLVIDAVEEKPRGVSLFRVTLTIIILALIAGFVVGVACLAVLRGVDLLQELVWSELRGAFPEPLRTIAPVLLCVVGGFAVGACTKWAGFSLDTLGVVIKRCKTEGGYRLKSVPKALLLFALPIAFGGSVGPEAGVSGFTAALVSSAMRAMRRGGVAAVCDPNRPFAAAMEEIMPSRPGSPNDGETATASTDRHYRKSVRSALWGVAGIGFVLGIMWLSSVLGPGSGLPRFEAISYLSSNWLVGALALVIGYALARMSLAAARLARRLALGKDHVARAVVCGLLLGVVAIFLPDVLFSGQAGTREVIVDWQQQGALMLAATCVAKLVLTQVCVACDWIGGEFFPMIFCGVCAGYAISLVTGVDPMLPVAVATAALVAGCIGKPVLTTCVLALCFPLKSLPVVAAAAFVAAKLHDRAASQRT